MWKVRNVWRSWNQTIVYKKQGFIKRNNANGHTFNIVNKTAALVGNEQRKRQRGKRNSAWLVSGNGGRNCMKEVQIAFDGNIPLTL